LARAALATTTLSELGYRVIATGDGEQAVREFEKYAESISIVVLDVVMPRLGAGEAYERMRTTRQDVRVLSVSGYAAESIALADLLADPRIKLLEKPFSPKALAAAVRSAIDARWRTVPRGPPARGTLRLTLGQSRWTRALRIGWAEHGGVFWASPTNGRPPSTNRA
jgi:CheY-like chemotaxis protein